MTQIQTEHGTVGRVGHDQVTAAARCDAASSRHTGTGSIPLRNRILRKRSRMLVWLDRTVPDGAVEIGGEGIAIGSSYPVVEGKVLELPISPNVLTYIDSSVTVDVRTLEIG